MHCRTEVGDFCSFSSKRQVLSLVFWILGVSLFSALLNTSGFLASEPFTSASSTLLQVVWKRYSPELVLELETFCLGSGDWFDFPSLGHFLLNPRKQKDQHYSFQAMFCLSFCFESRGDLALFSFQSKLSQSFILLFVLQFFYSLSHSYHLKCFQWQFFLNT